VISTLVAGAGATGGSDERLQATPTSSAAMPA
jgi:hypothetical protein